MKLRQKIKKISKLNYLVRYPAILAGIIMLVTGFYLLGRLLYIISNSEKVEGIVTNLIDRDPGPASKDRVQTYSPEIEFHTTSGEKISYTSFISTNIVKVGDKIDLYYRKDDPGKVVETKWSIIVIIFSISSGLFLTFSALIFKLWIIFFTKLIKLLTTNQIKSNA